MPVKPIVIRAKHTKGITKVRAMITHPMLGYNNQENRNNGDNRPHFIQEITCSLGEETILSALCGGYVAPDPLLGFAFRGGNKGEIIKVSWVDNWGEKDSVETIID